jgi:hypothetical protein
MNNVLFIGSIAIATVFALTLVGLIIAIIKDDDFMSNDELVQWDN